MNAATAAAQMAINQTSSVLASQAATKSNKLYSLFGKTDIRDALPDVGRMNIAEQSVLSVEEFCPDGETLEKGFLDDVPSASLSPKNQQLYRQAQPDLEDSDSDGHETGNPLVARFTDDPADNEYVTSSNQTSSLKNASPPLKVNPLSKNKNKSTDFASISNGLVNRKSSMSSDDMEIPVVMKTPGSADNSSGAGCVSTEEFDSWLSDTNQRRSPEGGEDVASLPSTDKASIRSDNPNSLADFSAGDSAGSSKKQKDKKHSKKKKEKKDKHDKDEDGGREKKKKKPRSKECAPDEFISGHSEYVSMRDDGAYEAF